MGTTAMAEDTGRWVTASVGNTGFRVDILAGSHALTADEPVSLGGTDHGPTPYEYMLAALGSCMVMTLRMYADRKGWPLTGATLQLRSGSSHEIDCENCETKKVGIGNIDRRITLHGTLTDEQRARLLQIVDRCPVKQTMERGMTFSPIVTERQR
jgi:putative redox protein